MTNDRRDSLKNHQLKVNGRIVVAADFQKDVLRAANKKANDPKNWSIVVLRLREKGNPVVVAHWKNGRRLV